MVVSRACLIVYVKVVQFWICYKNPKFITSIVNLQTLEKSPYQLWIEGGRKVQNNIFDSYQYRNIFLIYKPMIVHVELSPNNPQRILRICISKSSWRQYSSAFVWLVFMFAYLLNIDLENENNVEIQYKGIELQIRVFNLNNAMNLLRQN